MTFTPSYTVSCHGQFLKPGTTYEIDPKDAEALRPHGIIHGAPVQKPEAQKKTARKPSK